MNFGLPGGMKTARLYQHLRESGIVVTMDEADFLRQKWFTCFAEMNKFMNRSKCHVAVDARDVGDYGDYRAVTITGFVRNKASYNASLNTRFQQPVANLAKRALWNLERYTLPNGDRFGNRLLNFVHDEVIYWLYPEEVYEQAPIIKQLWLSPGKEVFPDVMLKAEIALSLRWDKHAIEWPDIKWTNNKLPILEEPEGMKEICA